MLLHLSLFVALTVNHGIVYLILSKNNVDPTMLPHPGWHDLTSIANPIVEIRRSQDHLISTMGIPILVRLHFHIEWAPVGRVDRADPRLVLNQWEMSLQSNAVSHWLITNLESALSSLFFAVGITQALFLYHKTPLFFPNQNVIHCLNPYFPALLLVAAWHSGDGFVYLEMNVTPTWPMCLWISERDVNSFLFLSFQLYREVRIMKVLNHPNIGKWGLNLELDPL